MRSRDGRRVALWAGAAGFTVVCVAVFALRERLTEAYLVHRLATGTTEARVSALSSLEEMGSLRAVPTIARLLGDHPGCLGPRGESRLEASLRRFLSLRMRYPEPSLGEAVSYLVDFLRAGETSELGAFALGRIGFRGREREAVPLLIEYAKRRGAHWPLRHAALTALRLAESEVEAAAACLAEIRDDPSESPQARYRAACSLEALGAQPTIGPRTERRGRAIRPGRAHGRPLPPRVC